MPLPALLAAGALAVAAHFERAARGSRSVDPKQPYTLRGIGPHEGRSVVISPDGLGSTPNNRSVEHLGFIAWMRPSQFQKLNPARPRLPSQESKAAWAQQGIGAPMLYVRLLSDLEGAIELLEDIEHEEKRLGPGAARQARQALRGAKLKLQVTGHEGRGRMLWIEDRLGDVEVPVSVILERGLRARHLQVAPELLDGAVFLSSRKDGTEVPVGRFILGGEERSPRGSRSRETGAPAAAQQGARQQGARQQGVGRACPKRFSSPQNQLAGLTFYHGSSELFPSFDPGESRTSYGMFFAADPDTAAFYGEHLYRVKLFAKKVADLDDPPVLRKVLKEAVGGGSAGLYRRGRFGGMEEADKADLASWATPRLLDRARSCPRRDAELRGWLRERASEEDVEEHLEEVLTEELRWDGFDKEHDLWPLLSDKDKREFGEEFIEMDPEVMAAESAYGTQQFYMEFQDYALRAAEAMGYDCVVFSDPSPSGESLSYVVFSSDQVCIVGMGDEPGGGR